MKNKRKIRVWKLGDHKQGIFPTVKTIEKFTKVLTEAIKDDNNTVTDIVWDSCISVELIELNEEDMDVVVVSNSNLKKKKAKGK